MTIIKIPNFSTLKAVGSIIETDILEIVYSKRYIRVISSRCSRQLPSQLENTSLSNQNVRSEPKKHPSLLARYKGEIGEGRSTSACVGNESVTSPHYPPHF